LNKLISEFGSFRDPAGKVFYSNGKVYRELSETGIERYQFIKNKNLIKDLIDKEYLINTNECEKDKLDFKIDEKKIYLEHEKIDFISYPYEWSFTQLKDAAIFHLDFQIYLIEKGIKLIDASAFNIQFKNNKPIFIDVLSLCEYKDGEYWYAHKQFCENFLNPLILSSKKGIDFNNWFRGNLEGIHTRDLAPLLNFKDLFSPTVFFHVYLLNKLDEKSKKEPKKTDEKLKKAKSLSKKNYLNLLTQLKNYITNLKNKKRITNWDGYSDKNTYDETEEKIKLEIIKNFVDENKPNFLADLGCNEGKFSEYASKVNNIKVIGIDFDLNVLDKAFLKAKKENKNFFPIYADFSNPSNNLGWNGLERKSLVERSKFDGVIALALIHHLVIAKNIPLSQVLNWLTTFAPKGLIEFVPKDDPTIKIMLKLKGDIFPEYNESNFREKLSTFAKIKKISEVTKSKRKIYEFSK